MIDEQRIQSVTAYRKLQFVTISHNAIKSGNDTRVLEMSPDMRQALLVLQLKCVYQISD